MCLQPINMAEGVHLRTAPYMMAGHHFHSMSNALFLMWSIKACMKNESIAQSHHFDSGGAGSFEESFCVCTQIDAAMAVSLIDLFCPCSDDKVESVDDDEETSLSVSTKL